MGNNLRVHSAWEPFEDGLRCKDCDVWLSFEDVGRVLAGAVSPDDDLPKLGAAPKQVRFIVNSRDMGLQSEVVVSLIAGQLRRFAALAQSVEICDAKEVGMVLAWRENPGTKNI